MDKIFLTVLNMSLTGAFVIAAVILARIPLKKAPKVISYCLWAVVGFRLVFPFSIESVFSLMPMKPQIIPTDIAMQTIPQIDSGIPYINYALNRAISAATPVTPTVSVNPFQIWVLIGSWLWIIGVAILVVYGVASFIFLKRKMKNAVHVEANIYEAAHIKSPFVLGILTPRIYLPTGLSAHEREYILLHEQTHIRRRDHIIKFAAYFIVCFHWFNPFVWLAFLFMGADMEMSCDERVVKELGERICDDYSMSLVRIATGRRILAGSPLAFGEGGIKERIKRILNFKKPSRAIIMLAIVLVAMLSAGFAVNRVSESLPWTGVAIKNDWPVRDMTFDSITFGTDRDYIIHRLGEPHDEQPYYEASFITYYFPPHQSLRQGEYVEVPGTDVYVQFYLDDPDYIAKGISGVWRIDVIGKCEMTGRSDVADGTLAGVLAQYGGPDYVERNGYVYKLWYHSPEDFFKRIWFDVENGELTMQMGITYILSEIMNESETMDAVNRFIPPTSYKPREWVNLLLRDELLWSDVYEITLDEFPDTTFTWTWERVSLTHKNTANITNEVLFIGSPIWNVFFADLNGDGLPELCATVNRGSGIDNNFLIVYDYANKRLYSLDDRMYYDYVLSVEGGQLVVTQTNHSNGITQSVGSLAIIDGELVVYGIDRIFPADEPQALLPADYLIHETSRGDTALILMSDDFIEFYAAKNSQVIDRNILEESAHNDVNYLAERTIDFFREEKLNGITWPLYFRVTIMPHNERDDCITVIVNNVFDDGIEREIAVDYLREPDYPVKEIRV